MQCYTQINIRCWIFDHSSLFVLFCGQSFWRLTRTKCLCRVSKIISLKSVRLSLEMYQEVEHRHSINLYIYLQSGVQNTKPFGNAKHVTNIFKCVIFGYSVWTGQFIYEVSMVSTFLTDWLTTSISNFFTCSVSTAEVSFLVSVLPLPENKVEKF